MKVQNALNAEHVFDGMKVVLTVLHGVVTLSGTVTSQAAKVLASEEAGQVDGVKTVLNNLEVRSPNAADPASPTPPPAPSALAKPVETLPRTISLPAGSFIAIRTSEPLSSKTAKANDEFHGMVAANISLNNLVLIPSGTAVLSRVVDAKEAGHFVGQALLSIELISARLNTPDGPENVAIVTEPLSNKANGRGANTAAKTGGGAAVGALIGALAGGGTGAGIGALAGGGLGVGANAVTRGQEINVQPETLLRFRTAAPLPITIMMRGNMQILKPAPAGPALEVRLPEQPTPTSGPSTPAGAPSATQQPAQTAQPQQ